jgi:hypothetical protein
VRPEPVESGLPQRGPRLARPWATASTMRRGATATRRRPQEVCCGGHSTRWTSSASRLRPIRATWHLPACRRNSDSCRKGRCEKTAS